MKAHNSVEDGATQAFGDRRMGYVKASEKAARVGITHLVLSTYSVPRGTETLGISEVLPWGRLKANNFSMAANFWPLLSSHPAPPTSLSLSFWPTFSQYSHFLKQICHFLLLLDHCLSSSLECVPSENFFYALPKSSVVSSTS